jgi:hypothetical protein
VCFICLDTSSSPIQSGCACRGATGLTHVGCRVRRRRRSWSTLVSKATCAMSLPRKDHMPCLDFCFLDNPYRRVRSVFSPCVGVQGHLYCKVNRNISVLAASYCTGNLRNVV